MTFDEALNDKYCLKIMGLLERWLPKLDKSELKQLQLIALHEAVTTWDGGIKSKFTTHLYNRIKFKYLRYVKNITHIKNKPTREPNVWYGKEDINLNIFFDGISKDNREILEDRYVYNYSVKDIAKKRGIDIKEVRNLIKNAKQELKIKNET